MIWVILIVQGVIFFTLLTMGLLLTKIYDKVAELEERLFFEKKVEKPKEEKGLMDLPTVSSYSDQLYDKI